MRSTSLIIIAVTICHPCCPKKLIHQAIELLSHQAVKLSSRQAIKKSSHQAVELLSY
jgi:hypothetical protein